MESALGYYDEYKYVLELLEKGKIDTESMISDVIPLADLEEKGFQRLMASSDMVKILVEP